MMKAVMSFAGSSAEMRSSTSPIQGSWHSDLSGSGVAKRGTVSGEQYQVAWPERKQHVCFFYHSALLCE